MPKILVVDDQQSMRRSVSIALSEWEYDVDEAGSGKEALALIDKEMYDLVLTDLVMEPVDGIELLQQIERISPYTEVLLMSAHGTIPRAVEAMRHGAGDFILKPFNMEYLQHIIKRLLDQSRLKRTVRNLQKIVADTYSVDNMVAASSGMKEVMRQAALIADWSIPVLIQGESGTGKELVAMAVHKMSSRSDNAFIPVNCGAFSETLLDSELFGHCRGAFTGAVGAKAGLIEEADGGTLLLDEIGEAPQAMQVRLLRFLDNGRFRRIGEVTERHSDVRIIAATNRDLQEEIGAGNFREDLYYRLSAATIDIPPLRKRPEDIPVLTRLFVQKYCRKMDVPECGIHAEVLELFQRYPWPGNVRELENAIERALIICGGSELKPAHVSLKEEAYPAASGEDIVSSRLPLREVEKKYILSVLEHCGGNRKQTADILQISRTTLISRLKRYGVM